MFAQQLHEFCQSTLFIRAQMIMNVPAQIILPEIEVVFLAAADDVVQGLETKILRVAKLTPQGRVIDASPQGPDGIDKRQTCQLAPHRTEIPNGMRTWRAQKIDGRIPDQQSEIRNGSRLVAGQRLELRFQA